MDFALSLGGGSALRIRVGKFATLVGEETINPTTNYFYSHTYEFGYAIPFTNTGVMAQYVLNSEWSFWAGVTRPWNQSTRAVPDSLNFLTQVDWTPSNAPYSLIVNYIVGPNDYGINDAGSVVGDYSHERSVLDVIGTYTGINNLTLLADVDWGYDGANSPDGSGSSNWFAVALYQSYVINSYLTFNTREEYYFDGNGATILLTPPGVDGNYGDLTAGFTITPMPNSNLGKHFTIHPEIREDLADHGVLSNGKHYQTTVGIDAIYTF